MKNRNIVWLGPISIVGFVVVLAVMYGWVGSVNSVGYETRENPEVPQAQENPAPEQDPQGNAPDMQQEQGGRLAHHGQFPAGIGNSRIQLINETTIPTGIGDSQIRLINQNRPGGPYLGLSLSELSEAVRKEFNIPAGTGVYVHGVLALSPAEKAGIQTGDVLLKCAHKPVNTPEALGNILAARKAGEVVKLVVNRDGKTNSFHAKLENAPLGLNTGATQNPVWMGADIQDIDAIMKIRFNLPDRRGVIVSHVAKDSPALAAGLRTGDVIKRFGETRIRDVKQMQSLILAAQPGRNVTLAILRDGLNSTLEVTMERHLADAGNVPFLGPADVAIEGSWIGMDVTELSAGAASELGLPAGTRGILVNDVESPPATMVGFQTGDAIVAVNGQPTLDMKQFEAATKEQSGAVVDVIRGNKHLFISVPPPGFTQQGAPLTGGMNKMRQVALLTPAPGKLGIFTNGPELDSGVSGNLRNSPYLLLVDPANNSYAILEPNELNPLSDVFQKLHVTSLVCSDISRNTANFLIPQGVTIYAGVTGQALDAIGLYEQNQLVAMRGF